ncbi:MAG: DNA polymerase III subunit [Terriglobales bacterium]
MPFADFVGSSEVVARLRGLIAARQMSRTLVLCGPNGIGRTTLATMIGLALNCLAPPAPGDFCGACASCTALQPLEGRTELLEQALAFREEEVRTQARERAPLAVALHPQIRWYPPDGDFLTIHQARQVTHDSHLRPNAERHWALILDNFDEARWLVQTALLKTLEEPPDSVCLLLLVTNPLELLPTVLSRSLVFALSPAPESALRALLEQRRPGLSAADRGLLARLAQGRPGRALNLDLAAYRQVRDDAFGLVQASREKGRHDLLFALTGRWRAGKEKFESLLEILYSVLQDIEYLNFGRPESVRNLDARSELCGLAAGFTLSQLSLAVAELDRIASAVRRNANRSLALDAWALRLDRTTVGAQ